MTTKRQRTRAGEFIVTEEPGAISRDNGYLAEGQNLEAGTLLAESDGGDLVAWQSGACAGILFAGCNATAARQRVTVVARLASVNFELLSFGDAEEGAARDALQAIRLTVRSDHLIADTGGGGGGGYVAKAVHFDGSIQGGGPTYLSNDSLSAVDSKFGAFSLWVKGLFVSENSGASFFQSLILPDGNTTGISTGVGPGTFVVKFNASGGAQSVYTIVNDASYPGDVWFHLMGAANAETGALAYYISDELVTPGEYDIIDTGTPFVIQSSGLPYVFGDDTFSDGPTFDCADVWIAPGADILSGDGLTIPEATRRLFISATGKPVNPSGFPSSAILFSGDAATFATNQGTGGPFTTTGTMTNATTSPSD